MGKIKLIPVDENGQPLNKAADEPTRATVTTSSKPKLVEVDENGTPVGQQPAAEPEKKNTNGAPGSDSSASPEASPSISTGSPFLPDLKTLFNQSPTTRVAGKNIDLSTIPAAPMAMPPAAQKKAQDELFTRIQNKAITDDDARLLGAAVGAKPEDVKRSVEAPVSYELENAHKYIAGDVSTSIATLAPMMKRMGLDPARVQQEILNGDGSALRQYYTQRSQELNNQLQEIQKQKSSGNAMASVYAGFGAAAPVPKEEDPQLQERQNQIEEQLKVLNDATSKVLAVQLNKQFDVPDKNKLVKDFDLKAAESIGSEFKKTFNPVGYANDEKKLNNGFVLSDRVNYDNAKAGIEARLTVLAAQMDDARNAMRNGKNDEAANRYNRLVGEYNKLVEMYPKLSDNYPEVRREEMVQGLLDAYYRRLQGQRAGNRAVSSSLPGMIGWGDVKNVLSYIFAAAPDKEDIAALSKETGISVDEINKLAEENKGSKTTALRVDGLLGSLANSLYGGLLKFDKTGRRLLGSGTDVQKDVLNEEIDKRIANVERLPAEADLFQRPVKVDIDKYDKDGKLNPYFLRERINQDMGKFNLNPQSFVHNIGDTGGQVALFALGGEGLGAVVKTVGEGVASAALAENELNAFNNAYRLANISQKVQRAGELAGTFGSSFAMGYDDYYKAASEHTNDEDKRHLSAAVNSAIDGVSELIFPDVDIVRAMRGEKSLFKIFDNTLKEHGGIWTADAFKTYTKAIGQTLAVNAIEGAEEVFSSVGQALADSVILNKKIDTQSVAQDAKQSFVSAFIGTTPMGIGAGIGSTSRLKKEALFEAGNAPKMYTSYTQDLLAKGKIDQAEADRRISTINTMSSIVRDIPARDPHGNPYSIDQKVEIAAQEFRIRKNNQLSKESGVTALKTQAEQDKAAAEQLQADLLNGKPIYRVNGKEVTADELKATLASEESAKHQYEVVNDPQTASEVAQQSEKNKAPYNAGTNNAFIRTEPAPQQQQEAASEPSAQQPAGEQAAATEETTPAETEPTETASPNKTSIHETDTANAAEGQAGGESTESPDTGAENTPGQQVDKQTEEAPELQLNQQEPSTSSDQKQAETARQEKTTEKPASDLERAQAQLTQEPDEYGEKEDVNALFSDFIPKNEQQQNATTEKESVNKEQAAESQVEVPQPGSNEAAQENQGEQISDEPVEQQQAEAVETQPEEIDARRQELYDEHPRVQEIYENPDVQAYRMTHPDATSFIQRHFGLGYSAASRINRALSELDNLDADREYTPEVLDERERITADKELQQDDITLKDIEDYEASNRNAKRKKVQNDRSDRQTDRREQQQAGDISQTVQQSGDERAADTAQDQGSAAVEAAPGNTATGDTASGDTGEVVPPAAPAPKVPDAMQAKLAEKRQKFLDALRESRGNLNSGIDPKVVAAGAEMVAAYAEAGLRKFGDIIRNMIEYVGREFFADKANTDALKGVYAYHRSNQSRAERGQYDNEDQVDDFIENELPSILNSSTDDTGTASDLEPDSARGTTTDTVGTSILSATGRSNIEAPATTDGPVISAGTQPLNSPGILPVDATTEGTGSDSGLSAEEQYVQSSAGAPGLVEPGRSSSDNGPGDEFERAGTTPTASVAQSVAGQPTFEQKLKEQRDADGIEVVPMDTGNIAATLPLLQPGQHEDVYLAERRFYQDANNADKEFGKGYLFTNGTGTGKTLTGAGIAKRFYSQGKENILIVTPTDLKCQDWIKEASWLNLPVTQLPDTETGGTGPVTTTYANFQQNEALAKRDWDLIIYDESHKIMNNKTGDVNTGTEAHRKIALTYREAVEKATERIVGPRPNRVYRNTMTDAEVNSLAEERAAYEKKVAENKPAINQMALDLYKRTKVVFLSATPFSYHPNLKYADGFLFTISQHIGERADSYSGYNVGSAYDQFMMQNFGYRMRYNKLTRPESGVDVDLMERNFAEFLKQRGVMSGRTLQLEQDYSRDFIREDDATGSLIDEGISAINNHKEFTKLPELLRHKLTYHNKLRLLESLKAKRSIERIKEHLAQGRKVVVFHDYNEGTPEHPFRFDDMESRIRIGADAVLKAEYQKFREKYPQYEKLDLDGLKSAIDTIKEAFGKDVLVVNGTIAKKTRQEALKLFNDDNSGKNIILFQSIAGAEGNSLHDTTGKHQRVLINLGLPVRPTLAIQTEGRIYRIGNKSNAIFEYPVLGLNFEKFAYAETIAQRTSTAENLALGEQARDLDTAYKEGFLNAKVISPAEQTGLGGKEFDRRQSGMDEFDKARSYYYARQKGRSEAGEDYFATPEPLGFKMMQWANIQPNESALEPSAGHGAISRWFPKISQNELIEPSDKLRAEAAIVSNAQSFAGTFEDLNTVNKYHAIIMNPPFGRAGKTAYDHFIKATHHLKEGGRIVALVPTGKMTERMENWLQSPESNGFEIKAHIQLPSVTFNRAGTSVNTQIYIVDKTGKDSVTSSEPTRQVDLSHIENINDLFSAIKDMDMPERPVMPVEQQQIDAVGDPVTTIVQGLHTKKQVPIWTAKLNKQLSNEDFDNLRQAAKDLGGYYSSYRGQGAIPGFIFNDEPSAIKFNNLVNGNIGKEEPSPRLSDLIRQLKIKPGGAAYSMILPVPQVWNAAVDLVANLVKGGENLVDALRKGMDYIRREYKESWDTPSYTKEMVSALKSRGVLQYQLTEAQKREADKVIGRLQKGARLVNEILRLRNNYQAARQSMVQQNVSAEQLQQFDDNYREFEQYILDGMVAQDVDRANKISLDVPEQTFLQKQEENWIDYLQRLGQYQREIEAQGITIGEHNDMMNRADRWRSIAEAKIDAELSKIGLGQTDILFWKGQQKIKDSLFDRMAKAGVDWRKFNLYLYALHAPERNAHNAKIRRERFMAQLTHLYSAMDDANMELQRDPDSASKKAKATKAKNELDLYQEYLNNYDDPAGNKTFMRLLEKQIPERYHLMTDGGSGMTNKQAQEILDEVDKDPELKKHYEEFEKELRTNLFNKILDLQQEYGMKSIEDVERMRDYYNKWVPLRVEESYFEEGKNPKIKSAVNGSEIFHSKGADYITYEDRNNPITQAIAQLRATIIDGEQNNFRKTIAEGIRSAPDSDVWEIKPALYEAVKDRNGRIVELREINPPSQAIPYKDDGSKKYLVIKDPALYNALSGKNLKGGIELLSRINSYFRTLHTTANPEFVITNILRDMETAGTVISSTQKKAFRKAFKSGGILSVLKAMRGSFLESGNKTGQQTNDYWRNLYERYVQAGGNMSWLHPEPTERVVKDVEEAYQKYLKNNSWENGKQLGLRIIDMLQRGGQSFENATRLKVFDAALKAGFPEYKAVEIARNATVNFNRKGNYSGLASSMYLFFNANVQGTANMVRSVFTTRQGLILAGKIAAVGVLQSIWNNMWSDCGEKNPQDCYDNIRNYEKDRNIILKLPGVHGFIKIPMAYGLNTIYNFGENVGQIMMGKEGPLAAGKNTLLSIFNNFNPMGNTDSPLLQQIAPTALDPVVQWFTNRDAFGRPIYKDDRYDHRPDSQQTQPSDTEISKKFAAFLNRQTGGNERRSGKIDVSPGTLDWMYETATGGLGLFMRRLITTGTGNFAGNYSAVDFKDIPILNRFYSHPKENIDTSMIWERLNDSYTHKLSPKELEEWNKELDRSVKAGLKTEEKAQEYRKTMQRNQFELDNGEILERAKHEKLSPKEMQAFFNTVQEYVKRGELPQNAATSYRREISKKQHELDKKK